MTIFWGVNERKKETSNYVWKMFQIVANILIDFVFLASEDNLIINGIVSLGCVILSDLAQQEPLLCACESWPLVHTRHTFMFVP